MTATLKASALSLFLCLQVVSLEAQEPPPPKEDHQGNPVSIIRNDASSAITIETQLKQQWQPVTIDANKDASVSGDHVRVATTRDDGAVVTVALAIGAGKKYRVFWNAQASMWDIAVTP
jgi:hypothetical protein